MNSSVPLLTRSSDASDYSEWKLKMIICLRRQKLFSVSIGLGRHNFESDNDWLKAKDKAFEIMELALSPSMRYHSRSIKDPEELWTRLNRTFGSTWSTPSTISILDSKVSASTLSDEVVQDEDEAEASTQSIRIEDSLHAVTPSPDAPEVHEISDISSSHISETEEDIQISDIEEKFCFTSMQTFTGDFPLNSVQNLLVIASESEEKFDFLPLMLLLVCKYVIPWIFWKKYHITRVIHSLPMIYIFQQNPAGLHAPKFIILKKKKVVHPPSRLTIYLNLIFIPKYEIYHIFSHQHQH